MSEIEIQSASSKRRQFLKMALLLMLARTVINLPRRFPYPFLPEISRQLNVGLPNVQQAVASQTGIGIISPLLTPIPERRGRKETLLIALSFLIIGGILGGLFPRYGAFYLVLLIMGLSKTLYDPAMQTYIGDQVPYAQRGTAIGIVEVSWSLSLVVAAPLAGFLLDMSGLAAIFWTIAVLGVLSWLMIWRFLPADKPDFSTSERPKLFERAKIKYLLSTPAARASLIYAVLLVGANEILLIVFGAWLEVEFNLELTSLGLAALVIAFAEVTGEMVVIGFVDRIGKQKMAVGAALLASLCYLALPYLGVSLIIALGLIFVLFVGVETAIVSSFPIFTEVLPNARALMMTSLWGAHAFGRVAGATVGGLVYQWTDSFSLTMNLAFIGTIICAFILWRFVPDMD